jgi:hypothetical protein
MICDWLRLGTLTEKCSLQAADTGEWASRVFDKQNYETFKILNVADQSDREKTGVANHVSASFPLKFMFQINTRYSIKATIRRDSISTSRATDSLLALRLQGLSSVSG